ncbi:MAG: DUF1013 domain-containing protein [Rhodospirillales bacterium]|nr:DUF1013 domain-containing protein [Rhodospirillales bacterium]
MAAQLEPTGLLMPKATAVWLIDNTVLTFQQIGDFAGLHEVEIQALADGDVGRGIVGRDPVLNSEVEKSELEKAEADPAYRMKHKKRKDLPGLRTRSKGPKYTPVSKRGDKPDAIAWILKNHPDVKDAQIVKLIGTTKPTINAIRERSHANMANIRPRHPADLGLCSYMELNDAINKALRAAGKDPDAIRAQQEAEAAEAAQRAEDETDQSSGGGNAFQGFDFSNFLKSGS